MTIGWEPLHWWVIFSLLTVTLTCMHVSILPVLVFLDPHTIFSCLISCSQGFFFDVWSPQITFDHQKEYMPILWKYSIALQDWIPDQNGLWLLRFLMPTSSIYFAQILVNSSSSPAYVSQCINPSKWYPKWCDGVPKHFGLHKNLL